MVFQEESTFPWRTVTDNVTGVTGTYSYHYDEEAPNTAAVSEAIAAGGTVYNTAESEFRGHSMSEVVDPQGLATVNFFYQNDTLKGRLYRSLLLKQTFYDDLNVTFPGTAWSATGTMNLGGVDNISNYGLKIYSSTTTNSTALRTSTMNGNMAFAQFRINSTDTNTQGEVGLISTGGKFFGVVAKPVTGGTGVYVRTNTGGGLTDSSTALIPAGTFKLDKWYGVMLIMDNSNGFRVKAWQMGDLNNSVYESVVSGYTSDTWKLRAQANSGALWFDTPAEGTLYTESTTRYNVTTQVAHGSLATSTLQQYTDLNVNWAVPVESISRNYDGKSTWFGTRATTEYNTADQGGTQYGNATRSVASSWNGSAWVDDHASKTEFYPLDNGTKYLVGLPARSLSMSCSGSAADGSDCDFSGASGLLGETLNIYDANSTYSTAPTTGLLKITRARLDDSNGVKYGETGFSYDAWGNQTGVTSYSGYGTATSSPTIGARSVTRTYDTTYNTYVLSETNPLSQVTHTAYDYTLGLPNSVTDANNITTTAGYDAFGRMTSVVAPGDSSGSPTLNVAYYNYASSSSPFRVLLTQKLDASRTMQSVRSYNGLGKLIQSQTLAADVSGASKTIVQDSQYDILGRLTKQTKPYTYTGSYAFQTQTFGQPLATTTYDILSRVTQVLDANGTHSDSSYSGLSTTQTDPKGNSTTSTSDVWGRVVSVAPATGPGLSYVYDKASHLTTVTKGTGGTATTTTLGYDRAGRKTSMSDPDMGSWSYGYDALSALTGQTDARSCSTTIAYDLLGRPTGKTYAGAGACGTTPAVSYYYDGTGFTFLGAQIGAGSAMLGQRTGMIDGSGATVWTYDSRGRKTNESKQIFTDDAGTQVQTFSTGWGYNSADMPVSMTYPDSEVDAIGYNAQGALSSLKKSDNSFTYVKGLVYDEAGRTTNLNLGDTGSNAILSKVYSYFGWSTTDTGGQLNSMSVTNSASASLQNLVYNYDKNGNITSINNQKAGETSTFGYDSLNRLTGNTVTANVGGATVFQEAFAYDANTGSMSGKGPTLSSLVSYTYDPNHKNAVSAFGTNGYGYDANGNQTSRNLTSGNYTLTYDAENHMVGVSAVLAPTATPTSTMTSSPTVTGTASPTASSTNTATVTQTASSTATQTATVPTATATATVPTATASNTALPSATATLTVSSTATLAPSATNTPLPSPTATNTLTGSETATATTDPNQPTATQTASLTATQVPPTNTPGNTNTPAATNTASVSPTASLTYTASVSPTVTNTVTATMTLTPSNTTTSSPTASPTGPTPTPTATTIPTEPTPEPLQSAKYVYDGDGNMVKAIVNSTLGNTTTTYYPGRHYNVEVKNGMQKVQKYYSAGSTIIAVRTVVNGTDTLQWMVSDQIGSTSVTANADGTWNSEIRYTAFGEIRWKNGVTPTNYRYTGQLDTTWGLQFYASRFYDSSLAHFVQPDSIIPSAGNPQAYDHYAYVNNSPIMFNDPSGHDVGFGNAFPSDPGNGFDSNTSRNVWLNYGGYQSSFIGQVITTPVKQFDQHFIDWSWWSLPRNAPLPRTSGINICGLVAPNGINNKTWLDVGDAAVKHGFSYSTGMQPSQAAATYCKRLNKMVV